MFTGIYTALVTPLKEGKVDELAFERLIKAQVKGGVDGIVPVGTTGESPTLSFEEHMYVVELAVKFAASRVKVLAGTGGNSTDEAIYLTIAAEKGGADGSRIFRYDGLLERIEAGGVVEPLSHRALKQ